MPAFLLGLTLFFYWKVLFTNRAMFPWDAADFFYPYYAFVHEELRHFRLPLWDPYVMSGFPIIGDLEAQIFYPINWLFVLLSPFSSLPYRLVEIKIILHFFLAGLFMYLLARDFVENETAALLAGVLFMYSGAMVVHTQHVASVSAMAWYPLIFLLARRGLRQGSLFHTLSAGIVFGIQILAGHWQHSVYLGLLLFLYFAYEACFQPQRARLWPRCLYQLLFIAGLGAALAMIQIIPSIALGLRSVRINLTYWDVAMGNDPRFLWTLFLPNFFGGINGVPYWYRYPLTFNYAFLTVPGFLLAMLGLWKTVRERHFFWVGAVLLFTELSFGDQGHLAGVLYRVPVLNQFRVMATFFDITNFLLCLMAAIGLQSLLDKTVSQNLRKYLPGVLAALIVGVFGVGWAFRLSGRFPDWNHFLAVLVLSSLLVAARLWSWFPPQVLPWAFVALVGFELCFYNQNQAFNNSPDDPRTFLSRDYAVGRKGSLEFLRFDTSGDFRVAGLAEFQWSGNGWNIWRIPGVLGWNPLALSRYDEYLREFISSSNVHLTAEGQDHNLRSPLLDLLGVKYVVLANPEKEQAYGLSPPKFRSVYGDMDWWRIYRNENALPKAWFFPKGYAVPDPAQALALMTSSWFDPRRFLLFEKNEIPGTAELLVEELPALTVRPQEIVSNRSSGLLLDPYCAEELPMVGGWGRSGDWMRFEVPGPAVAGRYLLSLQYTANQLTMPLPLPSLEPLYRRYPWYEVALKTMPQLEIEVENARGKQFRGPISLPRTQGWACHVSRISDFGEWELTPGLNQILVRSREESALNIYGFQLIRLPSSGVPDAGTFATENFSIAANRISFDSRTPQEGFLLLNEIHYPGWQATVDGQPSDILRADGIFRALLLPAGSHHIEFRFQPDGFAWGAVISLFTALGFLTYVVLHRRRRPPQS